MSRSAYRGSEPAVAFCSAGQIVLLARPFKGHVRKDVMGCSLSIVRISCSAAVTILMQQSKNYLEFLEIWNYMDKIKYISIFVTIWILVGLKTQSTMIDW
jgi:hypothetical protein